MDEKAYNILLTVLLAIIGTAILVGGGIIISTHIKNKQKEEDTKNIVEELKNSTTQDKNKANNKNKVGDIGGSNPTNIADGDFSGTSGSRISNIKMENYNVVGVIKIPKIKLEYPILDQVTKRSLEIAVAQLNTQRGINNPGNTTILGHNYRNNMFFAKLHLLTKGDKITVTDVNGGVVTYEVYEVATRTPNDTSYIARDTGGKREISLSTCNDDSTLRHVVLAREV